MRQTYTPRTPRRTRAVACPNWALERHLMRFCSGLASITWLRRSISIYRSIDEDGSFYTLYEDRHCG